MKVVVLCLNDFPIGVYSTHSKANAEARSHGEDKKRIGLKPMMHYHTHEFVIDGESDK